MVRPFNVACRSVVAGVLLLTMTCSYALGDDGSGPDGRGTYVSVFGGGGVFRVDTVTQSGTALIPDNLGGPLSVNAAGRGDARGAWLGGLQIGHEWAGCCLGTDGGGWALLPAAEVEGFYLGGTHRAGLVNPTNRLPLHAFSTTFPTDTGVFITNAVLSLKTPAQWLTPYVGGGIGAAGTSIHGADSTQLAPPEPGINHFNSNPNASCWGFAAQAKAGLRLNLAEHCYVFAEYRYLYVGSTTYTFGSTQFPGHVPTTPWSVRVGDTSSHLGVGGIGFSF